MGEIEFEKGVAAEGDLVEVRLDIVVEEADDELGVGELYFGAGDREDG